MPGALKYGFHKKLLWYKWTSDKLNTFFLTFWPDQCADVVKKCLTGQRFICTKVTSYKIYILVESINLFLGCSHCSDLNLNDKRPGVASDGNFSSFLIRRSVYDWLFLFPVGRNGNNPIYPLLSAFLSTWTVPETCFG